jgi:Ca2+-binding EF-hand superfamily protein
MIKPCLVTFVLFASATFVNSTSAQGNAEDGRWLLSKYDANGDRVISVNEIEARRKRVFTTMDQDQDGDVSYSEYQDIDSQRRSPILKARFQKLDLNRDGALSGEEYASYLGSFDRMDTNSDGEVSAQEMNLGSSKSKHAKIKNKADACLLWVCLRKRAW